MTMYKIMGLSVTVMTRVSQKKREVTINAMTKPALVHKSDELAMKQEQEKKIFAGEIVY